MSDHLKYDLRGVSATKNEVHAAIKNLDKGLYPNAFCKILPDVVANDPNYCNIMHADTAGTKTSLAYMYWRETGDLSVWKGIAQDALVMNLDDMACVGCTEHFILSSTIGRNKNLISGDVVKALIEGTMELLQNLADMGIDIHHAGGETADVGDIVRTLDVGFTAFARMPKSNLIISNIQPGDVIVGMASYGQSSYETEYNGGMGSNGLTSARHDVLHKDYATQFPDSYDHNTPQQVIYTGTHRLTDTVQIDNHTTTTIGKLILSPTRTFLPVLHTLLAQLRPHIHALIHATGGGQTKVLKFAHQVHIVKDNLFHTPPLFQIIQQASHTTWHEMYRVFNMGCRMECYIPPQYAQTVIDIAHQYNIDAQIIGHVLPVANSQSPQSTLHISTPHGTFQYTD